MIRVCGLLVRLAFMAAISSTIETKLAKHIPGYHTYKALAEEKLQNQVRILPPSTALIKQHKYWLRICLQAGSRWHAWYSFTRYLTPVRDIRCLSPMS